MNKSLTILHYAVSRLSSFNRDRSDEVASTRSVSFFTTSSSAEVVQISRCVAFLSGKLCSLCSLCSLRGAVPSVSYAFVVRGAVPGSLSGSTDY
jgi:hypothetical protein